MKKKITLKTVSHEENLKDDLRDPEFALAYVNAAIEESAEDLPEAVLLALRRVAEVQGMTWLSQETGLARPHLYKMLDGDGNPELLSFIKILSALGMRMAVQPARRSRRSR